MSPCRWRRTSTTAGAPRHRRWPPCRSTTTATSACTRCRPPTWWSTSTRCRARTPTTASGRSGRRACSTPATGRVPPAARGTLVPDVPLTVSVASAGVPAGATAVALNITAVAPKQAAFVRVAPCGQDPLVSSLNVQAGQIVANAGVVALSSAGSVCVTANVATDVLLDVTGWYGPGGGESTSVQTPTRLVDTRSGLGGNRAPAGSELGVIIPRSSAVAATVSVAVVEPGQAGLRVGSPVRAGEPVPRRSTTWPVTPSPTRPPWVWTPSTGSASSRWRRPTSWSISSPSPSSASRWEPRRADFVHSVRAARSPGPLAPAHRQPGRDRRAHRPGRGRARHPRRSPSHPADDARLAAHDAWPTRRAELPGRGAAAYLDIDAGGRRRPRRAAATPSIPATASWPRTPPSPALRRRRRRPSSGPRPEILELFGDKVRARDAGACAAACRCWPGSRGAVTRRARRRRSSTRSVRRGR